MPEELIQDLCHLETEGITVTQGGRRYKFSGNISYIAGDSLGSHSVGGFMEGFNANRFCRFCTCSSSQLKEPIHRVSYTEKTKEGYKFTR